ncbi:MAG: CDP-glucose 4,6-dehydratase [Candidatus Omnitrophota bacterium]
MVKQFLAAYSGKKVLITGNTGFKGSWLTLWLKSLGAFVYGYSIDIPTQPSLYKLAKIKIPMVWGDVADVSKLTRTVKKIKPDIIFHLAAQPLVRASYRNPFATHRTNVMGSAAVLEAARLCQTLRAVVMITTDKVYENQERNQAFKETDPLGGYDPYSASKAAAEILIASYRSAYFNPAFYGSKHHTLVASLRAGNVIGGGDFAEDRLIPDCFRAFAAGEPVLIRNPKSVRPWQHVLEPLAGYLQLSERLLSGETAFAGPWNFGPEEQDTQSVSWVVKCLVEKWGQAAAFEIDKGEHPHEASYLRLDITKAKQQLRWKPRWNSETALTKVVDFYKAWQAKQDIEEFCLRQIKEYSEVF